MERLKQLKKKPKKFQQLSKGEYLYNYDIQYEMVTDPESGEYVKEYNFIQVQCWGHPNYDDCVKAVIRAYVSEDEELDLINTYASSDFDLDGDTSDAYEEYLSLVDTIKYNVQIDFGLVETRNDVIVAQKKMIRTITKYDSSDAVNGFYLNGSLVWLDKATRVGLMNSLTVEKNAGKTESTLWFDTLELNVDIDTAISLLSSLELYALECYNVTAAHKAAVYELTTVAEVEAYDYTTGYPDKLEITI